MNTANKSVKTRFSMWIVYAAICLFSTSIYGANLLKVTRSAGDRGYDAAVNRNFDAIMFELFNVVHKTGTETIMGAKTFSDSVTFGAVTINTSLSMGGAIDMNSHKITELTDGSSASDAAAFGQIPVAATQAQMEAASSNAVFATPGRTQNHPGVSKAWVIFTSTGTLAIMASYNVTSVTDNGVGDFQINYTTSFSDTNYSCHGGGTRAGVTQGLNCNPPDGGVFTSTATRITCHDDGSSARDSVRMFIYCFGDQ